MQCTFCELVRVYFLSMAVTAWKKMVISIDFSLLGKKLEKQPIYMKKRI